MIARKPRKPAAPTSTLLGEAEVLVIAPKKQGRASAAANGESAIVVPRKKGGRLAAPAPAFADLPMPKKKGSVQAGAEGAERTLPAVIDVRGRKSFASARMFTTLMQVLILGLSGFVAARQFHGADQSGQTSVAILAWLPVLVRGSLLAGCAVLAHCFALHRQALHEAWARSPSRRVVFVHFALGIANFVAVAAAPPLLVALVSDATAWLVYFALAPLLWAGYLATGVALLLPGWRSLERVVRVRASALGGFVLLCYAGWRVFERSSYVSPRMFTQATMVVASWISAGLGHPLWLVKVTADGVPVYRAGSFTAFIFPGCSGLEGMMLTAGMLLAAIAMERRRLRIWLALAMVGLAVCCAFLANAVRLVVLFYIGDIWSPEIAETGFHANFGVVSFVVISIVFFIAIRRYGDTARSALTEAVPHRVDLPPVPPMRLAYPLMATVAATLLLGLFSGNFNWLYPIPMLVGAALLLRFRLPESEPDWTITLMPVGAGVFVFWLWLTLIPADPNASAKFAETLFSATPAAATLWLLARFAGSVVVVPMTEELTFRALLVPLTMRTLDQHVARGLLVPLALLLNALAFGAMHSGIMAGTAAGLIFGLVFWRRRSCRDAILAHTCSNLCLCLYALGSNQWSYL